MEQENKEMTFEEIHDLQERLEIEDGHGRPRYIEVIDEYGNIDWEYID